jgi:hypothetical protein
MPKRWMKRIGVAALVLLYLGFWAVKAKHVRPAGDTDLELFFLPSARIALSGHPLHIYQVRSDAYPNANGPLGTVPLTIVAALAAKLGILDDRAGCRVLVAVAIGILALLLSREAVLSVDVLRNTQLRGARRLLAYGVLALCPELPSLTVNHGHIEHPLMLLLLFASVRRMMLGRHTRAGLLLGAALLTRTSAVLYLPPLALALIADGKRREALRFTGSALLALLVGLLPFVVADRANLVYSLFTSHRLLPAAGGSFWAVAPGSALAAIGERHDGMIAVAVCVLLAVLLLARFPHLRPGSGATYGLLAICGLCLPLLMKSVWPYYYLDAYALLALWWLSRARRFRSRGAIVGWLVAAVLPLCALLASHLAAYALKSSAGEWTPRWSLTMAIVTVAIMALVAAALRYPQGPGRSIAARNAR